MARLSRTRRCFILLLAVTFEHESLAWQAPRTTLHRPPPAANHPSLWPKARQRRPLIVLQKESAATSESSLSEIPQNYQWTKQNIAIALPALIGMLADPLLSLMDTAYVGRVGSMELAALGACTSIFHLAFNAFRATTAATTSLVANSLAKNRRRAQSVTSLSLKFGWWLGVSVLISLLLFGNKALSGMGVAMDSPLYSPAAAYLFTRCWAAPVVLVLSVAEGAFRGYGDTVIPLAASLTAAFINLILDPVLMFKPVGWGVRGAAAATAISQFGAAVVYAYFLFKRTMLPPNRKGVTQIPSVINSRSRKPASSKEDDLMMTLDVIMNEKEPVEQDSSKDMSSDDAEDARPKGVIRTIIGANLSMMVKQGSLLFGWAFATARATRLGPQHVAAHQVALSVWLIFAMILDGTAVSAQVLMSRAHALRDRLQVSSLTKYMVKFALLQGLGSMIILDALDLTVPRIFTPDLEIQKFLHEIMPHLAAQQVLVSMTLVMESLAAGANQFGILAGGTFLSTLAAIQMILQQTSVDGIWSVGISTLFVGRLLTAAVACWRSQVSIGKDKTYDKA